MVLAQLTQEFRRTRADRASAAARRPPRTPLAVRIGRALGKALPRLAALRTAVLSIAGFGLIDYAAWTWVPAVGYAAAGLSLLAIEYLISTDRSGGT